MRTCAPLFLTPPQPMVRMSGPASSPAPNTLSEYRPKEQSGTQPSVVVVLLFPRFIARTDLFQGVLGLFPGFVGADQLAPVRQPVLLNLVGLDVVPVLSHRCSPFRRPGSCGVTRVT